MSAEPHLALASRAGSKACPYPFDHQSDIYAREAVPVLADLRAQGSLAWTSAHGGYWVASRYRDIVAVAQNGEDFGCNKKFDPAAATVAGGVLIPPRNFPRGLPIESDRPEWDLYRSFINRRFAPKAAEARRIAIRGYAEMLLDRIADRSEIDAVHDFAGPLPAIATMDLLGLPLEDWHDIAEPLHELVYVSSSAPEYPGVIERVGTIVERCLHAFHRYRALPAQDNLLSHFAHGEIDGRPVTDDELVSYCMNILPGGVDTTTSLTTNVLLFLGRHRDVRRRLIDDPSLLPIAREEFIRYFTPMHGSARNALHDVEMAGAAVRKGEQVYLAWASGNRDAEIFEQPDKLDIARFPNRHIAFGAGMHRCVGSFLARVMFEEMIRALLARAPEYSVDPARARPYPSIGTINGWIDMPLSLNLR